MLGEKRVSEAEDNVRNYLEEGLLRKAAFEPKVFSILKRNADESLGVANFLSENARPSLWIITAAYYSMFYLANALLYKLGYKVGDRISHKVTADALIVFARNRVKKSLLESYEDIKDEALATLKSDELIESLDFERRKRGVIQYNTPETIKKSKAETSLKRARTFMLEISKLLSG